MTDLATLNERGLSLPTLREQVRDAEPEVVTNTRDDLAGYVELFRKQRDTEAMRELLAAQRVIEWEMAQRWPPNGKGAHRSDERPVLASTGAGADNAAWQRVYVLRKHDPDKLLDLPVDELSYRALSAAAKASTLGYVGTKPGDKASNEWFTPAVYIDSVRQALGGCIGLDPFSSPDANGVVGAERFLTIDDDALTAEWGDAGTVFMNCPYSSDVIGNAADRYLEQWGNSFHTGIVLVNNATETAWFQKLLAAADAVCFTDHRISFWNIDGKPQSGNTRGQVFLFHGRARQRFANAFEAHGVVIPR